MFKHFHTIPQLKEQLIVIEIYPEKAFMEDMQVNSYVTGSIQCYNTLLDYLPLLAKSVKTVFSNISGTFLGVEPEKLSEAIKVISMLSRKLDKNLEIFVHGYIDDFTSFILNDVKHDTQKLFEIYVDFVNNNIIDGPQCSLTLDVIPNINYNYKNGMYYLNSEIASICL